MLNKAASLIRKYGGVTQECRKEFRNWVKNSPDLSSTEQGYSEIDDEGQVYQSIHMGAPEHRTDPKFFQPLIHPVTNRPCPVPSQGFSGTPEFMHELLANNEIVFGKDETTQPRKKSYLEEHRVSELSSLISSGERGKHQMDALGLHFPYCHPVGLYEKLIWAITSEDKGTTLDFFAGSGTNAHAVINLNRQDDGKRKYILVEMGHHFNTVLKPRVMKAVYAEKWRDAKPVSVWEGFLTPIPECHTSSNTSALNPMKMHSTTLNFPNAKIHSLRNNLLSYLLGSKTCESPTFLNVIGAPKPIQLSTQHRQWTPGARTQTVDLPETFNYLLGISVQTRQCFYD